MDIESRIMKKITKNAPKTNISIINQKEAQYFYLTANYKHSYITSRLKYMLVPFLEMLEIENFKQVNFQSTASFMTYGMISSYNGEQIRDKCYIFNTIDQSNVPVKLNLESIEGFSIYNGQIVAIKGKNPSGNEIVVEKIYCLPVLNYKKPPNETMNLTVLKGPFSQATVESMFETNGEVLFLLGPFCDFSQNGFDSIRQFVDYVELKLSKFPLSKAFIVPSEEDYFTISVFPQPKPDIGHSRVLSLPNPASLYLNGHLILISNFDSILDLCSEELYKPSSNPDDPFSSVDKMTRISYHMIFQKSLAPVLYSKSCVSYGDWLNIDIAPHLYILSSKMKQFGAEVGCSFVVNVGGSNKSKCTISRYEDQAKYNIEFKASD